MRVYSLFFVLVLLLSGCSIFRVPQTKPSQQVTPWAAQTVRDANNAERERFAKTVKKGEEKLE